MKTRFTFSADHMKRGLRPAHGPQTWPWWQLVAFAFVRLDVHLPSTGYRLWVYTRFGAVYGDIVFDRRQVAQKRNHVPPNPPPK
jgi:hypothetical protein